MKTKSKFTRIRTSCFEQCVFCGESFTDAGMHTHLRTHTPIDGARMVRNAVLDVTMESIKDAESMKDGHDKLTEHGKGEVLLAHRVNKALNEVMLKIRQNEVKQ